MAWGSEVSAHGNLSFSLFCSCHGCQWHLEHEGINWQDLPHPACSPRPPTWGHAAVALVCMKSWLQTAGTLGVRPRTPKPWSSAPSQTFGNSLGTSSGFVLYFRDWKQLKVGFCCARLPSNWGTIMPTDRHLHQRSRKSTWTCSLNPLSQSSSEKSITLELSAFSDKAKPHSSVKHWAPR